MARITRIYRLTEEQYDLLLRLRQHGKRTVSGLMDDIVNFIERGDFQMPEETTDRSAVQLKFQPEVLERLQARAASTGVPLIRIILEAAKQLEAAERISSEPATIAHRAG